MDMLTNNYLALSKIEIQVDEFIITIQPVEDQKFLTVAELSDRIIQQKQWPTTVKQYLPESFLEEKIGSYAYRSLAEDVDDYHCDHYKSGDENGLLFLKLLYKILDILESRINLIRQQSINYN